MDRPARILVVDDEKGIREGCRRVLLSEGHHAEIAPDGETGLAMARTENYDLVLVDAKMPGMGGIELVKQVQQIDPAIVCVVITGYATIETAIEATRNGAYDFVSKPFTPDELLAKVNKGLDRRWLVLEARRLRLERERSLLEISAEKSRLLTIINCMQDGVLVSNKKGKLVLYNPAALTMLQLSGEKPIGQPIEECVPVPEVAQLVESVLASSATSDTMLSHEIAGLCSERVLMANVAPVLDERSETIGAVTVVRDITALKRLDRMKSQFVAMVAHELRAPLAAIQGYMEIMLTGAAGDDPQLFHQMLERSRDRASALLNLIDNLLDVSSIEAGRIARRVEWIHLPNLLLDVVEMVRPGAESRGIAFVQELPANLPAVRADREDMHRVFANLFTNAIKYNRDGGRVRLAVRVEGQYLRVDVSDTGLGIPREAIPRLFDEFYRLKTPETRHVTGSGLGLSIVKRIVDAHHGFVEVESEPGEGSTFSVFLPIVESAPRLPGRGPGDGSRPSTEADGPRFGASPPPPPSLHQSRGE